MDASVERLMGHRSEFLRFLRNQGLGEAQSEDVLSSALVRALEPWRTLPPESSLLPWFYRVLRNAVIDQARRSSAAGRALERLAQEPSGGEQEVEARRVCQCTRKALASLKPEYAQLVESIDAGGASVEEAAKRAGISANNAHVRLHRARKALRERLEAMCGECATGGGRCSDCYCQPEESV